MAKVIRVELPEDGEGKYIEVINPLHLRRKEMRRFDRQDSESDEEYSNRFLREVVLNGNITAEDGHVLQYPLSSDDMDELTTYQQLEASKAFSDAMGDAVPKN